MYVNVCRCNIFINTVCGYCIYILYGVITFMMRSCNFCHACMLLHRKTKDKYFKVFEMAT